MVVKYCYKIIWRYYTYLYNTIYHFEANIFHSEDEESEDILSDVLDEDQWKENISDKTMITKRGKTVDLENIGQEIPTGFSFIPLSDIKNEQKLKEKKQLQKFQKSKEKHSAKESQKKKKRRSK